MTEAKKARLVELLDAHTIFRRNDCEDDAACHDENAPGFFAEIRTRTLQAMSQIFTGDYGTPSGGIKRILIYGQETEAWGCDALEIKSADAGVLNFRYASIQDSVATWYEMTYSGAFVIHWDDNDAS